MFDSTDKLASCLRDELDRYAFGPESPCTAAFTNVYRDAVRNMDMHYFDMTLADGRVFRVRVSDITPVREGAES